MGKKTTPVSSKRRSNSKRGEEKAIHVLMPYILGIVAAFLALCFVLGEEKLGFFGGISVFLKGLFSIGAWAIPPCLFLHAVFYKRDYEAGSHLYKFWFSFGAVSFLGAVCGFVSAKEVSFNISENYTRGVDYTGGGVVGGTLYAALDWCLGLFAPVVVILALIVFVTFLFGSTPADLIRKVIQPWLERMKENRAIRKEKREEEKERREEERLMEATRRAEAIPVEKTGKKGKCAVNLETGEVIREDVPEDFVPDDEVEIALSDTPPEPEEEPKREMIPIEEIEPEPVPDLHAQVQQIFAQPLDGDDLSEEDLQRELSASEAQVKKHLGEKFGEEDFPTQTESISLGEEEVREEYRFPPYSLLHSVPSLSRSNVSEQEATAKKLVETLASFGVKTSISGVAKGPSVTRYELQPQPGVRVRSIVNLTDDIALALAAGGVRIEAPIPGKEAVGIEVPNRNRDTVYIRELLEKEEFFSSPSKLYCGLGKDVGGKAIYCDLAKMPHILIAGATGMGKSVCLNSMIVSILYHASPEEVQMILIDPKKVEMSVYNGIPHLLVPVVSDPKKAAGTLRWAVIEMERRFIEMEDVGVRDIKHYNELTKNDPEKEPMTHVVIFIDELADLMMTARDEVETSICRLAQKARAAGMHLVIGTQRPSVDVITGLIKANVPSRIACTVASQVDSRTIIDIQGAEKLMGKGDMLYAPVGISKPLRVQGAFVDESELHGICDFIRAQRGAHYDEKVANLIDREAQKCVEKKKGGFAEGEEGGESGLVGLFADKDPLLERAIDVAVTEKKVSTSLLQRKLSVGYARAAKLIDFMAEMNVVGPYAGSKPREVLWSQEYYMEYKMRALEESPIQ